MAEEIVILSSDSEEEILSQVNGEADTSVYVLDCSTSEEDSPPTNSQQTHHAVGGPSTSSSIALRSSRSGHSTANDKSLQEPSAPASSSSESGTTRMSLLHSVDEFLKECSVGRASSTQNASDEEEDNSRLDELFSMAGIDRSSSSSGRKQRTAPGKKTSARSNASSSTSARASSTSSVPAKAPKNTAAASALSKADKEAERAYRRSKQVEEKRIVRNLQSRKSGSMKYAECTILLDSSLQNSKVKKRKNRFESLYNTLSSQFPNLVMGSSLSEYCFQFFRDVPLLSLSSSGMDFCCGVRSVTNYLKQLISCLEEQCEPNKGTGYMAALHKVIALPVPVLIIALDAEECLRLVSSQSNGRFGFTAYLQNLRRAYAKCVMRTCRPVAAQLEAEIRATCSGETVSAFEERPSWSADDVAMDELRQSLQIFVVSESVHRELKAQANKKYQSVVRGAATGAAGSSTTSTSGSHISGEAVEQCLNELLVGESLRFFDAKSPAAWIEVIQKICRTAAAAPYRKEMGSHSVVQRGDIIRGEDGRIGEKEMFLIMLKQLGMVTETIARAITDAYPTLNALYDAYRAQGSVEACENLLQDIVIRRASSRTSRRLGPRLSKRIHAFFTSRDPAMFANKQQSDED